MSYALFHNTFPWVTLLGEFFAAVIFLLFIAVVVTVLPARKHSKQKEALRSWEFDPEYCQAVLRLYPHLREADIQLAFDQLRIYFYVNWVHESKRIAMPSRLVDNCWHIFILDTRNYLKFCAVVFDKYLHHEPPHAEHENIELNEQSQTQFLSMVRAYQYVHKYEARRRTESGGKSYTNLINTDANIAISDIIPTLFSIDETMQIEDGFIYSKEFLKSLAEFDLKSAELDAAALDGTGGGLAAGCGDGGACGCGGSV
jgi:hypothetical protein